MLWNETSVRENIRNRDGKRVFYLKQGDQLTASARDWLSRERIEILSPEKIPKIEEKPEHMTHLNSEVLVPKTHPRIRFRGKLDTLEAELILCQLAVPEMKTQVEEILSLTRRIIRCDVLEEPMKEETLWDLTETELRKRSHFPQEYYGQPHFAPSAADGMKIATLNRARCAAREAELAAVTAFYPDRMDILRTMNRISSAIYLLMIQEKAKM
jgi:ethanolamine utilization cobalamin adenosyltransferase